MTIMKFYCCLGVGGDRFLGLRGGSRWKFLIFFNFFRLGGEKVEMDFWGWGGSDQKKSKKVVENRKSRVNNSIGKNDPKCQKNGVEIGRKPHSLFGIEKYR